MNPIGFHSNYPPWTTVGWSIGSRPCHIFGTPRDRVDSSDCNSSARVSLVFWLPFKEEKSVSFLQMDGFHFTNFGWFVVVFLVELPSRRSFFFFRFFIPWNPIRNPKNTTHNSDFYFRNLKKLRWIPAILIHFGHFHLAASNFSCWGTRALIRQEGSNITCSRMVDRWIPPNRMVDPPSRRGLSYMEVSWVMGAPPNHLKSWRLMSYQNGKSSISRWDFPLFWPSSYWGTPILGNPHILVQWLGWFEHSLCEAVLRFRRIRPCWWGG